MCGWNSASFSNTSLPKVAMPHLRGVKVPISAIRRGSGWEAVSCEKIERTSAPGAGEEGLARTWLSRVIGVPELFRRAPGGRTADWDNCAMQHKWVNGKQTQAAATYNKFLRLLAGTIPCCTAQGCCPTD